MFSKIHFMKKISGYFICLIVSQTLNAQEPQKSQNADFSKNPVWIQMIDDTNANFFEVKNAFTLYWKQHEMPSEDEFEGKRGGNKAEVSPEEAAEVQQKIDMPLAVRKYRIWCMQMSPYVQDDGRILTPSERIAAWQQQQDMLKQQANNNPFLKK